MIALESPEESYGGQQKEATTVPLQFGRSGEVGWLELNLDTVYRHKHVPRSSIGVAHKGADKAHAVTGGWRRLRSGGVGCRDTATVGGALTGRSDANRREQRGRTDSTE